MRKARERQRGMKGIQEVCRPQGVCHWIELRDYCPTDCVYPSRDRPSSDRLNWCFKRRVQFDLNQAMATRRAMYGRRTSRGTATSTDCFTYGTQQTRVWNFSGSILGLSTSACTDLTVINGVLCSMFTLSCSRWAVDSTCSADLPRLGRNRERQHRPHKGRYCAPQVR